MTHSKILQSSKRPYIGVSGSIFHKDPDRPLFKGKSLIYLEESLPHWVLRSGALPVLLPRVTHAEDLATYVEQTSGLILTGGVDVSPSSYGESPLRDEWSGDPVRDAYDFALIKAYAAAKKPIMGICRGHQVINVAFGGTLYQDISTQNPGSLVHRDADIYDANEHTGLLMPGSWLQSIYPDHEDVVINSVHHQAIKDLSPDFSIECISKTDGIIEAIRYTKNPDQFILGIQWHPEFHAPHQKHLLDPMALIAGFICQIR